MKEVPNRRLVGILIVVMFIAVAGTFFSIFKQSITGYASFGTVQITIGAISAINVNSDVNFGQSAISNDINNLTSVSTEAADNYGDFNNCSVIDGGVDNPTQDCTGIEVENQGTSNLNITMIATANVSTFYNNENAGANFTFAVLDGNRTKNETAMQIMGAGNEAIGPNNASCQINGNTGTSISPSGSYLNGSWMNWTVIPAVDEYLICGNLSSTTATNNTITIEFNLTIPYNQPAGELSNTFTFTGAIA